MQENFCPLGEQRLGKITAQILCNSVRIDVYRRGAALGKYLTTACKQLTNSLCEEQKIFAKPDCQRMRGA
jgi:hypothetical protein